MITFGSLYSGGGGADLGALAAGLTPIWGIEMDPTDEKSERFSHAAADCYEANISAHIIRVPVEDVDPHSLPPVEALHASPVCVSYSIANKARGEKDADKVAAAAVCRFLRVMKPRIFTLENVEGYAKSEAFVLILSCLEGMGYFVDYAVLNAANFGVAQTRRRLILRAVYGALVPLLPPPTPWVGWYEAIEDLIPTLPESRFADWQLKRLNPEMFDRCLLVESKNANQQRGDGVRLPHEPATTVITDGKDSHQPKAFIVDQTTGEGHSAGGRVLTNREDAQPIFTVTANENRTNIRAFLVGGANTSDTQAAPGVGVSSAEEPTRAVNASNSGHWRAWLSQGRVVSMTPRALSVFQSVPRWYVLPEKPAVATRLIGNMVPPLLMQKVYGGLTK